MSDIPQLLALGNVFYYKITGANAYNYQSDIYGGNDPIQNPYGSDIYAYDSLLSIAVVHAGAVGRNQVGYIKVTIVTGLSSYTGCKKNDIISASVGSRAFSILIEPYNSQPTQPSIPRLSNAGYLYVDAPRYALSQSTSVSFKNTTNDWTKVSSSYSHVLAMNTNGELYSIGYNSFGQLGDGTVVNNSTLTRIPFYSYLPLYNRWTDIATDENRSAAINNYDNLYMWGQLPGTYSSNKNLIPTQFFPGIQWNKILLSTGPISYDIGIDKFNQIYTLEYNNLGVGNIGYNEVAYQVQGAYARRIIGYSSLDRISLDYQKVRVGDNCIGILGSVSSGGELKILQSFTTRRYTNVLDFDISGDYIAYIDNSNEVRVASVSVPSQIALISQYNGSGSLITGKPKKVYINGYSTGAMVTIIDANNQIFSTSFASWTGTAVYRFNPTAENKSSGQIVDISLSMANGGAISSQILYE
jgi:hypothetical protein